VVISLEEGRASFGVGNGRAERDCIGETGDSLLLDLEEECDGNILLGLSLGPKEDLLREFVLKESEGSNNTFPSVRMRLEKD